MAWGSQNWEGSKILKAHIYEPILIIKILNNFFFFFFFFQPAAAQVSIAVDFFLSLYTRVNSLDPLLVIKIQKKKKNSRRLQLACCTRLISINCTRCNWFFFFSLYTHVNSLNSLNPLLVIKIQKKKKKIPTGCNWPAAQDWFQSIVQDFCWLLLHKF